MTYVLASAHRGFTSHVYFILMREGVPVDMSVVKEIYMTVLNSYTGVPVATKSMGNGAVRIESEDTSSISVRFGPSDFSGCGPNVYQQLVYGLDVVLTDDSTFRASEGMFLLRPGAST